MLRFHQFRILSHYLSKYCLFPILFTAFRAPNQVFASSHSVIQGPESHTLSRIFWLLASVAFWLVPLERYSLSLLEKICFPSQFAWSFLTVYCSLLKFLFLLLFLSAFYTFPSGPGNSISWESCFCLLLVSSEFGSTFSYCVSVERLCSLSWVWGSLALFLPCTRESPALGHVRWISGFVFPGSCSWCEVTPCPCVRAGLWLWDLRSFLPKWEPRSRQKVFSCSLLVT